MPVKKLASAPPRSASGSGGADEFCSPSPPNRRWSSPDPRTLLPPGADSAPPPREPPRRHSACCAAPAAASTPADAPRIVLHPTESPQLLSASFSGTEAGGTTAQQPQRGGRESLRGSRRGSAQGSDWAAASHHGGGSAEELPTVATEDLWEQATGPQRRSSMGREDVLLRLLSETESRHAQQAEAFQRLRQVLEQCRENPSVLHSQLAGVADLLGPDSRDSDPAAEAPQSRSDALPSGIREQRAACVASMARAHERMLRQIYWQRLQRGELGRLRAEVRQLRVRLGEAEVQLAMRPAAAGNAVERARERVAACAQRRAAWQLDPEPPSRARQAQPPPKAPAAGAGAGAAAPPGPAVTLHVACDLLGKKHNVALRFAPRSGGVAPTPANIAAAASAHYAALARVLAGENCDRGYLRLDHIVVLADPAGGCWDPLCAAEQAALDGTQLYCFASDESLHPRVPGAIPPPREAVGWLPADGGPAAQPAPGFRPPPSGQVRECFDAAGGGTRRLTPGDFCELLEAAGVRITGSSAAALFGEIDRNSDGVVSFDEWARFTAGQLPFLDALHCQLQAVGRCSRPALPDGAGSRAAVSPQRRPAPADGSVRRS
eukprot:TRINITY_DN4755_c0_g1_i2.p1 TRINITY_DN4755_c0_g1~~TRINITY_DN4755_c0_g1_i2.p1  ORF type:complete len:630 (+),score=170.11 TRINITY_DN4755_c0_g1_i2:73-1890(+)